VAIDGTKMKANASKHKAMSYERMKQDEARLAAEVESLLAQADATDAAEDAEHGVGQEPSDLPAELRLRKDRRAKILEARLALEKEAAAARAATLREQSAELAEKAKDPARTARKRAEAATLAKKRGQQALALGGSDDDDEPPAGLDDDLPLNRPPSDKHGVPKPTAQRNFTDPQSRIRLRDGAFLQAYNARATVDDAHQIIVAVAVSNQSPDAQYFRPMLPAAGSIPVTQARQAMLARLREPSGRTIYARRKATVEPVFGQIRACRGFRQLSFRGLLKNRAEWAFVCLTHNVLKLFRASPASSGFCPA
jgi:hypothetical protein